MNIPKLPRLTRLTCFVLMGLIFVGLGLPVEAEEDQAGDYPPMTLRSKRLPKSPRLRQIHPRVLLLDKEGRPVKDSQGPLSLRQSCGQCHDSEYIESHNYHAQAGSDQIFQAGQAESGRSWDQSPGLFGRWDPLTYRRLSRPEYLVLDLGTAGWIQTMGARHVGGGPAVYGWTQKKPLEEMPLEDLLPSDREVLDAKGAHQVWDWKKSGTVELNCLLCHMKKPANQARVNALKTGQFRWASTATLLNTGLVVPSDNGYHWVPGSIAEDGAVAANRIGIAAPASNNCRMCHGRACRCTDPVVFQNSLSNWSTETTGTVFSPDRIFHSGMNIQGKEGLSTPWDVHAERLMGCTDCHHSMNNPANLEKAQSADKPVHLRYDARKLSINDYLVQPDHNLVKGQSAQATVARSLAYTMRSCSDCHDAESVHGFLPFKRLHFAKLDCKACHIAQVFAPVRQTTDWTMLTPEAQPLVTHLGAQGTVNDPATLITGFVPVLLPTRGRDGSVRLSPHHLASSWFWKDRLADRPVTLSQLQKALFEKPGVYHQDVIKALDENGDGRLQAAELRLIVGTKTKVVQSRLKAIGVPLADLIGEIQPYTISHGVTSKDFAVSDCTWCHQKSSRITTEKVLASYVPGGVVPRMLRDNQLERQESITIDEQGQLILLPELDPASWYIHGTGRLMWWDVIGILGVGLSLLGVMLHGMLRFLASRRRRIAS